MREVRCFGGNTCKKVADYCSRLLRTNSKPKQKNMETEGVLIFPILSDNRIPNEVVDYLKFAIIPEKMSIAILGDYENGDTIYNSPIVYELQRLLKNRNVKFAKVPLLVDTPVIDWTLINDWFKKDGEIWELHIVEKISVQDQIRELSDFLGAVPQFKLQEQKIRAIRFCTQELYPQPLINENTDWTKLNQFLLGLPTVTELAFPYAQINQLHLDIKIVERLVKLDLRGTAIENFTFLKNASNLERLNLSAIGLKSFPTEIWDIPTLVSLSAYKNQLTIIPKDILKLTNLKKLSLYRNNIMCVPELPKYLTTLNIGANPIQQLCPQEYLEDLSLRNCQLVKLPFEIEDFPNLKIVNVEKNAFKNELLLN